MREILFKARQCGSGEWKTGYVCGYADTGDGNVALFTEGMADGKLVRWQCDHETVCQYTGLKDADGERIFEHDKYEFKDTTHPGEHVKVVSFERGQWCSALVEFPQHTSPLGEFECEAARITGNIHDPK